MSATSKPSLNYRQIEGRPIPYNNPVSQLFPPPPPPPSSEQPYKYNSISQISMLYKVWGYYNNFDYEIPGVYYWYLKMPRCGCVENGLEYIAFHVQKHIAHLVALVAARICETRLLGRLIITTVSNKTLNDN